MNGIIYCIINKINNKKYIGQTTIGLKRRYQANWWKRVHNPYLKYSVSKYGIENFEFQILEYNIKSLNKLNKLEKIYAQKYNTYIPNGYNIKICGQNKLLHQETKDKISKANSKIYYLKKVTGEIIKITNLTKFCLENNLNKSAIGNLLCGISNFSQGYIRVDSNPAVIKMAKIYEFISPNGEYVRGCISQIAKAYNIKGYVLSHLVHKICKSCYGWTLIQEL